MHSKPLWYSSNESLLDSEVHYPIVIEVAKNSSIKYRQLKFPSNYLFLPIQQLMNTRYDRNGYLCTIEEFQNAFGELLKISNGYFFICGNDDYISSSRCIWTMHAFGIYHCSIWNGTIENCIAYIESGLLNNKFSKPIITNQALPVSINNTVIADANFIVSQTNNPSYKILDVRTIEEFTGEERKNCTRGGHIPNAIHLPHLYFYSETDSRELRPVNNILDKLVSLGINKDSKVICYCHTHMRSSFVYCVLKYSGFQHVLGYPGAFNDWELNHTRSVITGFQK
ncbi:MAG: rhodanese-like domain-containing protein [Methylacidiphilales bacterium]|nr:rhodanese-like domain-containing protein [Candidatus Methylacidiphilales bacterium]